jgi:glutamate synthase (NADPH) small chain
MGELGGFLRVARGPPNERDPSARTGDYRGIAYVVGPPRARQEAARCMDCGVPFCQSNCPLGNHIPDWNDLVYNDRWREAHEELDTTNDFPEFTGRTCPAPCEPGCVLAINDDPVSIKQIELAISERAFEEGWVTPRPPERRTGRRVAVVGSGPAGLAAASQLNRRGHAVTVFERDERPGGLLRFGIPDFKLEKWVVDRRIALLEAEGVSFECGVDAGGDIGGEELLADFDAMVLATGSRVPRELPLRGRELAGVHFAMDYLYTRNRAVAAQDASSGANGARQREDGNRAVPSAGPPAATAAPPAGAPNRAITARDRHVVVIGGGDTAMDCVGNAHREGAKQVTLLDIYPEPGLEPSASTPWPRPPKRVPMTYALEEGGERRWRSSARALHGARGRVVAVEGTAVGPPPGFTPVAGSEFQVRADVVLVAVGFAHPEHDGLVRVLGLETDDRGNVGRLDHCTSCPGVFAAGDAHCGQSLVVTAIAEGRSCSRAVDRFLASGGRAERPRRRAPALA